MLEEIKKEKIYFSAGDVVTIKHDIDNKPKMLVKEIVKKLVKDDNHFQGIRCFWYTSEGLYQEQVFSTKDLKLIKSVYGYTEPGVE